MSFPYNWQMKGTTTMDWLTSNFVFGLVLTWMMVGEFVNPVDDEPDTRFEGVDIEKQSVWLRPLLRAIKRLPPEHSRRGKVHKIWGYSIAAAVLALLPDPVGETLTGPISAWFAIPTLFVAVLAYGHIVDHDRRERLFK